MKGRLSSQTASRSAADAPPIDRRIAVAALEGYVAADPQHVSPAASQHPLLSGQHVQHVMAVVARVEPRAVGRPVAGVEQRGRRHVVEAPREEALEGDVHAAVQAPAIVGQPFGEEPVVTALQVDERKGSPRDGRHRVEILHIGLHPQAAIPIDPPVPDRCTLPCRQQGIHQYKTASLVPS